MGWCMDIRRCVIEPLIDTCRHGDEDAPQTTIELFGRCEDGASICVLVSGLRPTFEIASVGKRSKDQPVTDRSMAPYPHYAVCCFIPDSRRLRPMEAWRAALVAEERIDRCGSSSFRSHGCSWSCLEMDRFG